MTLLLLVTTSISMACRPRPQSTGSDPKIYGGRLAEDGEFPEVARIEYGCGATFVSPNTLFTAAHCLTKEYIEEESIVLNNDTYAIKKVYHHGFVGPEVQPSLLPHVAQQDFAIVVLKEDTDFATMPIHFKSIEQGAEVTFVGFGRSDFSPAPFMKQVGEQTVREVVGNQVVRLVGTPAARVGDSGGPLLVDGKIAGVCSFVDSQMSDEANSFYANLSHPENIKLMHEAVSGGAEIPGLPPLPRQSSALIAGKVFEHTFVCNDPGAVAMRTCKTRLQFQASGKVNWTDEEGQTVLQGTYEQDGSVVNVETNDDAERYTLYDGGKRLYNQGGNGLLIVDEGNAEDSGEDEHVDEDNSSAGISGLVCHPPTSQLPKLTFETDSQVKVQQRLHGGHVLTREEEYEFDGRYVVTKVIHDGDRMLLSADRTSLSLGNLRWECEE